MITPAQQQAQRNRNTIFVEDGEVESIEAFAGDQFIMRLRAPKCAAAAQPGSFVHLTCDASLPMRRPLSISAFEMRPREPAARASFSTRSASTDV